MESMVNKKHLFISLKNSKFLVDAVDEITGEKFRCQFNNGIYQTNSDDKAMALQNTRYYNLLYKKDGKLVVTDPLGDDAPLFNRLRLYSIRQLRSIAREKEILSGKRLQQTFKEDLIRIMIGKKQKLGHYATI